MRVNFLGPCTFIAGSTEPSNLPPLTLSEVAFVGRSNVGKSSLVNALTNRKSLARTSQTPGRTQQINFFNLDDTLILVDLPGYGYAKASKTAIAKWTHLMVTYLKGRSTLKRVYILVDARRGLVSKDLEMMDPLDKAAVSYQIVLTKADKVGKADLEATQKKTGDALKKRPAAHPEILITSSEKKQGIEILREAISALALS
ncbi:MAG: YihA family ribosome biogenesis GTP-binding protein [bacterium]|nr:YihA family ribosome biogenesis GTP-binding protein [bacterium]